MENKIQVSTSEAGSLYIREGALPNLIERKAMSMTTDIKGPHDYYRRKTALKPTSSYEKTDSDWDEFKMLVTVDVSNGVIVFQEDCMTNEGSSTITGKITKDPLLNSLGINSSKKYTSLELGDLLKMNRLLFADRDKHMTLIAALKDFKAKIDTEIQSSNDNKGNKLSHFGQKMSHEYDLTFVLKSPVIKNGPEHSFKVEINHDIRDKQVEFWLESVELHEILLDSFKKLVTEQAESFTTDGVPVVFI